MFGSIFLAVIGLVLFRQFEQDIDLATYNVCIGGLLILTVLFWRTRCRSPPSSPPCCWPTTSWSKATPR